MIFFKSVLSFNKFSRIFISHVFKKSIISFSIFIYVFYFLTFFIYIYKMEDLKNMNARELRNFAKTNKMRGYPKYSKKANLLNFKSKT